MERFYKKIMLSLLSVGFLSQTVFADPPAPPLDQKSAVAYMSVGVHAKVDQLNDFYLTTSGTDGGENAFYSGSETFRLRSNAAVNVVMTKEDLKRGDKSIPTSWTLDSSETLSFNTSGSSNANHVIGASATLGDIDDQEAGLYSATLQVTVSAL